MLLHSCYKEAGSPFGISVLAPLHHISLSLTLILPAAPAMVPAQGMGPFCSLVYSPVSGLGAKHSCVQPVPGCFILIHCHGEGVP